MASETLVFSVLASRVRCMFGLTKTDQGTPLLMGTGTLVQHHRDRSYHPDGWFGVAETIDEHGHLQIPVTNAACIQSFCRTFSLKRGESSGLSIVVPWVEKSFTRESVLLAVLEGFFWPILTGELTVEIESGEDVMSLEKETLSSLVSGLGEQLRHQIEPTVDLARRVISESDTPKFQSSMPESSAPKWNEKSIDRESLEGLRSELNSERPVAIRVPMQICPKDAEPLDTSFDIYLRQDPACDEGKILFIREGLIVSGVKTKRCRGCRALIVIDEGPLATFLGDAENPAHTEWLKENIKPRYKFAPGCLDYVVQCVPGLLRLLSEQQTEADPTLLIDLFSLPALKDGPKKPQPGPKNKGPGKSEGGGPPPLPPKPRRFSLSKRNSGFVVRRGDPEAEMPPTLEIQLGYGVRRGNAFKKYDPADFDLKKKPIEIEADGCHIDVLAGNRMRVTPDSPDFSVAVTGFDTNRDLHIDPRVKEREEEHGETA